MTDRCHTEVCREIHTTIAKNGDEVAEVIAKNADNVTDVGKTAGNVADASNKIPWDSWRNYEKVTDNGQEYAKVGNRLYSKHAVDRMQPSGNRFGVNVYQGLEAKDYGRSIAPEYIEYVINNSQGIFQPQTQNYAHTLGNVRVILNSKDAVVTVLTYVNR